MPDDESLTVSTTTDDQNIAQAVADADPEASRAPVETHGGLSEFRQSADGSALSYENPRSERKIMLERLSELENAEAPSFPVEEEAPEPGQEKTSGNPSNNELLERAALEDFIRLKREELFGAQPTIDPALVQQQPTVNATAEEHERFMQEKRTEMAAGIARIAELDPNYTRDLQAAAPLVRALDSRPLVSDALIAGGPVLAAHFVQHPTELMAMVNEPDSAALFRIARAAEEMKQRASAPRASNLDPPLRPVSGASTKSSIPPDEMSFSDYKAWRSRTSRRRY